MKRDYRKASVFVGVVLLVCLAMWAGQSFADEWGLMGYPSGTSGMRKNAFALPWYAQRWTQHLLAALFGGMCGVFFSDKLRDARRWFVLGVSGLFFLLTAILIPLIGNVIIFFLCAFIAAYLLRDVVHGGAKRKKAKPTTFGSAEWADLEHLTQNNLIGQEGFSLGGYLNEGILHPIHYTGDRHLLTVAPTRSGKGVSSIIPNLLTYQGSAVIIDPKGENAMITALRRGHGEQSMNIEGLGQDVHIVDPWGITGLPSSRFNPMDWLDPADEDINENAMILADSMIVPSEGGRDQFWDEEAKALLMGILLYVALNEDEYQNPSLGDVRDIISLGSQALNEVLNNMAASPNHIVSSAGVRTLSKEAKLQSSVLATLQAHTHFLDSPRMRDNLSVSDFSFEDLKTRRMTIYLVLPADRLSTFNRWLRLMIQQALTVNARNIGVKPDKAILFLLDEMAALGRLSMVEQAFSLMAGFGVQLWGIVQDLSQLERIYDKGWQTFIGNSGVIQYFGSRDLKTAEYFSKLCGVTTIEKFSFARSVAKAFSFTRSASSSGGSSSSSESTTHTDSMNTDLTQRNLAFPDELMVMRDNKELVFIENFNPIPARKISWFDDEVLKKLGVNLKERQALNSKTASKIMNPSSIPPKEEVSVPREEPVLAEDTKNNVLEVKKDNWATVPPLYEYKEKSFTSAPKTAENWNDKVESSNASSVEPTFTRNSQIVQDAILRLDNMGYKTAQLEEDKFLIIFPDGEMKGNATRSDLIRMAKNL